MAPTPSRRSVCRRGMGSSRRAGSWCRHHMSAPRVTWGGGGARARCAPHGGEGGDARGALVGAAITLRTSGVPAACITQRTACSRAVLQMALAPSTVSACDPGMPIRTSWSTTATTSATPALRRDATKSSAALARRAPSKERGRESAATTTRPLAADADASCMAARATPGALAALPTKNRTPRKAPEREGSIARIWLRRATGRRASRRATLDSRGMGVARCTPAPGLEGRDLVWLG